MGKKIYCPKCNRLAIEYDGKATAILIQLCRKCNHLVYYYPDKDEVKIKERPMRTTSSGMRIF